MKKRFIFDENYIKKYAKKDKLKWLIIGLSTLVLIVIIIIVVLATRNKKPAEIIPAVPTFEVKEELVIEAGSLLPEAADYFDTLENIDLDEIEIIYPDEFELSYDTSLCSEEEIEKMFSEEVPNYADYDCVQNYLIIPATYGITIKLQGEEYTVNLVVQDTLPPVLITKNVEIYEGDSYELDDFVNSCFDTTGKCDITYYTGDKDSEGNPIDYSNITEIGEHTIKIIATDEHGNMTDPKEAKLTILEKEGTIFTVTFNSNGGSAVKSKKVSEKETVEEPPAPTKEGYKFLGWYQGSEKFDFSKEITENITLTAKWEKIDSGSTGGGGAINVTNITLNYKKIYLKVGETKTVTAKVSPSNATNKTVTWSSSNNNIATVSNGTITGKGTGTVTITASAGGKSASVEVVVNQSGSGTTCTYGDATYNTNYILSVNLTQNNCAIDPNSNPNESLSNSDYTRLIRDLNDMSFKITGNNFTHKVERQKIKNTSGIGLVGYQITITVSIIDTDNPYAVLTSKYILKSDGSRQFLQNNICKNGICLNN